MIETTDSKESDEALRKQIRKTTDLIEKDQLKAGSQDDFDVELDDAKEDADQTDNPFTEESKGTVAPIEDAGETVNPISGDMKKRFSFEHDPEEETLRKNKKNIDAKAGGGTDDDQ